MTEKWRDDMENAPHNEPVLTYRAAGLQAVAEWDWNEGMWIVCDGTWIEDVTHWQHLPTPPQTEGSE